ncbi:MFS transporter [Virgibacillus phasianinus]|uniref:MFS transporter n=1 Tax=Virgibacillus phasianinus TaxID=2017483 RepID=A0A220U7P9_9BACI|nr:MFS transporter [Virgibacillus phasianinus]ASK64147.1 MFS transporter [Virgibacillus phasianinus]
MEEAKSSKMVSAQKKPIGYVGWCMVLLLFFGSIVNYLDRSTLSIANTVIADQFNIGPAGMGILLSAFLWPYALASLPAGWIIDKAGPKKTLGWSIFLWSSVSVISGFATGFFFLFMMRVLLGITESPYFASGVKVTNRWFPKEQRAFPTSVFNMGPTVAKAISLPLLSAIMLAIGWQGMFIAVGLLGFVFVILWVIFYRDPNAENNFEINNDNTDQNNHPSRAQISWGSLFKYRSTWGMVIGAFGTNFTLWLYLTWLPGYLQTARNMDIMTTGWVASIPFVAGIFGVPIGGLLSDYLLRKGFSPIKARKIPIVAASILAAAFVMPVPFVSSTFISVMLLSIGFFASSVPPSVMWTLNTDVAPQGRVASLAGIQNFGGFLGGALAPILTGVIVQVTGSFKLVFITGSLLCIVAAIGYGIILKRPITNRT